MESSGMFSEGTPSPAVWARSSDAVSHFVTHLLPDVQRSAALRDFSDAVLPSLGIPLATPAPQPALPANPIHSPAWAPGLAPVPWPAAPVELQPLPPALGPARPPGRIDAPGAASTGRDACGDLPDGQMIARELARRMRSNPVAGTGVPWAEWRASQSSSLPLRFDTASTLKQVGPGQPQSVTYVMPAAASLEPGGVQLPAPALSAISAAAAASLPAALVADHAAWARTDALRVGLPAPTSLPATASTSPHSFAASSVAPTVPVAPGSAGAAAARPSHYKTELCRAWEETGVCYFGNRCRFAHGESERQPTTRHAKYRTKDCHNFSTHGICLYGSRCQFIHKMMKPEEAMEVLLSVSPRLPAFPRLVRSESPSPHPRAALPSKLRKLTNGAGAGPSPATSTNGSSALPADNELSTARSLP
ncbi:unnamed protein product [Pedinophyceae sp. YPF-701]|nr:unnamed protein product [Pedinophyceae sp. YPF-701]